jgi:hypothetical protein
MFALTRSKSKKQTAAADALAATQLLVEGLPRDDSLAALRELAAQLDRVKADDEVRPFRAFEIVDLIDRVGRPHYRKAAHEYVLGQRRLTKFQETQLWTGVSAYLFELSQGYRYCLAKYEVGADSIGSLTPLLPVICARALRIGAARLKWSYLRYRPLEPRHWSELAALYFLAETNGFARQVLPLYRGAAQDSCVEHEFLKTLILAISSPTALLPEQIEIAERLIVRSVGDFVISAAVTDKLQHHIDLRSDAGPQRLTAGEKLRFTARAFGVCRAVERLQAIDRGLEQGEMTPRELSLTQEFEIEVIRATIRHLLRQWRPPLPQRRHSRQRQSTPLTVVHDPDEVTANIGGLSYPFVSEQETWLVDNRSDSGLHAVVMSPQGRWIEVGSLIAYREGEDAIWNAGLVRRVAREDDDTRQVAVETIAHGGAAVTVLPLAAGQRAEPAEGVLCTLLLGRNVASDEITLLMPPKSFSPTAAREMRAYDRRYRLIPLRLIESWAGYEIARFKVLQLAD